MGFEYNKKNHGKKLWANFKEIIQNHTKDYPVCSFKKTHLFHVIHLKEILQNINTMGNNWSKTRFGLILALLNRY